MDKKTDTPSIEVMKEMLSRFLENEFYDSERGRQLPSVSRKQTAMDELMAMTGLAGVKEAVCRQVSYHRIMGLRARKGLKVPKRLMHMILTGNPGTGKTTVARLIGRIYREEGILSRGHLVETNRALLVGEYIGQSEQKTSRKIEEARGGILFIDEIYSLAEVSGAGTESTRDFGMKVIDTLMTVLSDPESDVMVVGAGYRDNIRRFLDCNPGLSSRFPMVLDFKDFTEEELLTIARNHLAKYDFTLSEEGEEKLRRLLAETKTIKDSGNARFVVTLIENHLIPNLCSRIDRAGLSEETDVASMSLILPADIPTMAELLPLNTSRRHAIGFSS